MAHILMSILRWLGEPSHRRVAKRSTFSPTSASVLTGKSGLLVFLAAVSCFGVLFRLVRARKTDAVDQTVTRTLQQLDDPVTDTVLHSVSWNGFPPQSRLLPPSIAAALWLLGFRLEAVFQFCAWGTGFISFLVKRNMKRKRPSIEIAGIKVRPARIGGTSFPSGHVINYMGVYGFLAFLVHGWVGGKRFGRLIVAALGGLLALVGPSRIYLGHHWFTDVLASYSLGTAWLVVLTNIYRKVRGLADR